MAGRADRWSAGFLPAARPAQIRLNRMTRRAPSADYPNAASAIGHLLALARRSVAADRSST
ncbi:hypothetical protein WS68_07245 [Burkholderia sp. TSV86]|nr:hypothetical protein WS68_07245 [Burkholderia sp. TSV86]